MTRQPTAEIAKTGGFWHHKDACFIKIGGSLGRYKSLIPLCRMMADLAQQHRLVIIPGGGAFADAVRRYYRRYRISETAAHHMALFAMDHYGRLLGHLIPNGITTSDLATAQQAAESGMTPILLPAQLVIQTDPLPHSWQVTSDSIAAWLAAKAQVPRLILLKSVDGLFAVDSAGNITPRLINRLTVAELAGQVSAARQRFLGIKSLARARDKRGNFNVDESLWSPVDATLRLSGVDFYLPTILSKIDLEVWLINGRFPGRLRELIEIGRTVGTKITRR